MTILCLGLRRCFRLLWKRKVWGVMAKASIMMGNVKAYFLKGKGIVQASIMLGIGIGMGRHLRAGLRKAKRKRKPRE